MKARRIGGIVSMLPRSASVAPTLAPNGYTVAPMPVAGLPNPYRKFSQKNGMSALGLQRVLGFGSYETAWAWMHKLRRAMVRPDRELLGGDGVTVEMDQTFIGGRTLGKRGPRYLNKTEVVIAVERVHPGLSRTLCEMVGWG